MTAIVVVNKYDARAMGDARTSMFVNIMRPTAFGNPFVIGRDGTREEVVAKYAEHLYNTLRSDQPSTLRTEWLKLVEACAHHDKVALVCCCAPRLCHGHALKRELELALEVS